MRVMHIITRMIVGGAQENTLFNCMDLVRQFDDQVLLVTGPSRGAEGQLLANSDTAGLEIHVEPSLIRSIRPGKDWTALQRLKQRIREWKPDVVHTHSAKGGMLGRAAAWHCRVPCVIHTVHGAPFHPYQHWAARNFFIACERWAARRCHHLISVADAMTDLMVSANVAPKEKFTTIYSGMDVEPFVRANESRQSVRARLGLQDNEVVFGKIARLFHLKGHCYFIEAAKRVCEIHSNVKFLLIGDGLLRSSLEAEIARLGLTDRFVFTGLVPPHEVPSYIGAMDVLVHASLREGLARALPQALIAGKPIISFNIDGAREVTLDGKTGYLVEPENSVGLADAMSKLAASPSSREAFGQTGQRLFTEQFRHEHMTQRIRELYSNHLR